MTFGPFLVTVVSNDSTRVRDGFVLIPTSWTGVSSMDKGKAVYDGIDELSEELDRQFFEYSYGKVPIAFVTHQKWRPRVDLYECPDCFLVIVELGGVKPGDLHVDYADGVLRVYGTRGNFVSRAGADCHRIEISAGPFERRIPLRKPVDPLSISARYREGILSLELGKADRVRPGLFPIAVSGV